jgi:hypothetical protein
LSRELANRSNLVNLDYLVSLLYLVGYLAFLNALWMAWDKRKNIR